jgi:hypothetical protein
VLKTAAKPLLLLLLLLLLLSHCCFCCCCCAAAGALGGRRNSSEPRTLLYFLWKLKMLITFKLFNIFEFLFLHLLLLPLRNIHAKFGQNRPGSLGGDRV